MLTIWKFMIHTSPMTLTAPGLRVPYFAGYEDNILCVWAEMDTDDKPKTVFITILKTGDPIVIGTSHVGTVFDGSFAAHIYASEVQDDE